MIICLYDNPSYPIVLNKEPQWADLPMGYFQVDERKLRNIETQDSTKIEGTFIYAPHEGTIRPVLADHVLAAFSYKNNRYLYNASLTYLFQWLVFDHKGR